MKKKSLALIAVLGLTLCLTACTEPEHKITDPTPDKVHEAVTEDTEQTTEDIETKTGSKTDRHTKTQEESSSEHEKSKDKIKDGNKATTEATETTNATTEATTAVTTETTTETTTEVDPYAGLAVSNVHNVVVPKGTSYNEITDRIIDGCTAYPNTYPVIDNVDNNTPGLYQCYWVRLMDDGTYLPLNYAGFTVTITD